MLFNLAKTSNFITVNLKQYLIRLIYNVKVL